MENTVAKLKRLPIKAFTLLESLLVLFVVSFLLLGLSGSVRAGFNQFQEQLFFLEFERLYQETQRLSLAGHEKLSLEISGRQISKNWIFRKLCRIMSSKSFSLTGPVGIHHSARLFFRRRIGQLFTSFIWAMASLKRRQLQASILLEALVAMAVFAAIASLLLGQISRSRKEQQILLQQEEVLRVARMALQTGQEEFHINGIAVRQLKTDKQLLVYHEGEVVIRVQKP